MGHDTPYSGSCLVYWHILQGTPAALTVAKILAISKLAQLVSDHPNGGSDVMTDNCN